MKTSKIILTVAGTVSIFIATVTATYFFVSRTTGEIENTSWNKEITKKSTTDDKTTVNNTSTWRASADLSKVTFTYENSFAQKTYTYNNETVNFSPASIINPTTGDKQNIRIYSAVDDGDGLPLVVLVSGGVNDGTEFEKEKEPIGNCYIWEIKEEKYNIRSVVSNLVSAKYFTKTIIVIIKRGNRYSVSGRRQDRKVSIFELLKKCMEGLEESFSGGHIAAGGGYFLVKDLDKFKENLKKYSLF